MSHITTHAAMPPPALSRDASIISRREIEPLLAKARQTLMYYSQASGCAVMIQDRAGLAIAAPEYQNQMRICAFCRKKLRSSGCFYAKAHAVGESPRAEGTDIFSCALGFVFWTGALYRNGRYAGALTAGQVIPSGERETVADKFRALTGDEGAIHEFGVMLGEAPEKNPEEIKAMARLLGVCAGEISDNGDDPGEMIRRTARRDIEAKGSREPIRILPGKSRFSGQSPASGPREGEAAAGSPDYPLEKERFLLAAFRRGDNETGSRILNELMGSVSAAMPGDLEILRFRAIELAVLLSRSAPVSEASGIEAMLEANNRYLKRIQDSKTAEELFENLRLIAERLSGRIFSFQGVRHASVLRRAERYIWENYTRKVSLGEIARASGLSAPYFSTVFKEEMGENLSCYLNRLRVERAATLLTETGKALNEIAVLCGFDDQSWFSKIFKNFTGISPGKFREKGGRLPLRKGKRYCRNGVNFPESFVREENDEDVLSS